MAKHVLIISANPWPQWIAVERMLARQLGEHHVVDGIDLVRIFGLVGPNWSKRDQIYERLLRNYARFVRPFLTGRDLTPDLLGFNAPVPPLPASIGQLRKYRLGECALGLAALSSAASLSGIADNVSVEPYGDILYRAWRLAHLSYGLAGSLGDGYDQVYIFNGSHSVSRPFCDVMARSAQVFRYEGGAIPDTYLIWPDSMHDPENFAAMIRRQPFNHAAGAEFFHNRLHRRAGTDAAVFTSGQVRGSIPPSLEGTPFVSFFNNSPDEYFAIDDHYRFGEIGDQGAVALALARVCGRLGKPLAIRLHPNLAKKHPSWRREWDFEELKRLGVLLIEPEERFDTYALILTSNCVVSCGSTTGVEAAYWGVPSLSVGQNPMTVLGATALARNEAEIELFVKDPYCMANARKAALLYGSFFASAGQPIPDYSTSGGPETAMISGRRVDPIRFSIAWLRQTAARFARAGQAPA